MSMKTGMHKYANTCIQTMKQWKWNSGIIKAMYQMVVAYCYLEREIDNVLKFHMNNTHKTQSDKFYWNFYEFLRNTKQPFAQDEKFRVNRLC